ncbi:putative glycosyl hydrolase [Aspergillus clavatus NRRL 1]|uniref:Glycosyl hydrolase, putative n=1 Tax=Aspergillus clavatus (strain ATCC 1007 / CBS 513.65 / DSM 816 / NCTC 3887 / NRRL 1 / QM 1276 / 107) TaxID=344612 RepID=A1CLX3_ASPCL|nr:glycosyl hydrolase, putative [Aspergillus clavatus NRRL 1]EAW09102.1 glycosyl hydrolase, putative [Aspergillus clavatus NRRL 1]
MGMGMGMGMGRAIVAISAVLLTARAQNIVNSPGDTAIIPGWSMQSSLRAPPNLSSLSLPGEDVDLSSWYRVSSRATVMAGLVENGVYNDTTLFYSDNMETSIVDRAAFDAPWLYREEFTVGKPGKGEHLFLKTHGITSKADIYLNGALVAPAAVQQGSYGGHTYDITGILRPGQNVLLVQACPTNYLRDFAQGFVDWNPYPADNGTGVWRHVEVSKTGPVSISSPRVLTDFARPNGKPVTVNVLVDVTNHDTQGVKGLLQGTIQLDSLDIPISQTFSIKAHETKVVTINAKISSPEIWWPGQWGSQPLYTLSINATVANAVSDVARPRRFGVRQVTSHLNAHNDTAFTVNDAPFLVLGGGYAPDLFLRFDRVRVRKIFQYMLDIGLNTVRLEGNQEHPELYDLADEMGLMVMAGWKCCDKWEGWDYNNEADGDKWTAKDYPVANASMIHEAAMMQTHPSMLAFLVGSDFWPNDRATKIYLDALHRMDWPVPIIASASKRGYPQPLGPSGMKMDGPYDWVPPNYFYGDQMGAAFGFGSEQGSGVGTPELPSLKKFLSPAELESLWKKPKQDQYHMSRYDSSFYNRALYNKALFARYGKPGSLDDYLRKAQMMDYETTRAEFEAFSVRQNATRPATGVVYWMLNSAWPNLHWQLFDYYLSPAGAYFGAKVGARMEHVAYDYEAQAVYLVSHALQSSGARVVVSVDLVDLQGQSISHQEVTVDSSPSASKVVATATGIDQLKDVGFLRLRLQDVETGAVLSRNVYWVSAHNDALDWDHSDLYYTPVTKYANYQALGAMSPASITASVKPLPAQNGLNQVQVTLDDASTIPAFFVRLAVFDKDTQEEITPVYWSDNYVTVFHGEQLTLTVAFAGDVSHSQIVLSGGNVGRTVLSPA